MIRAFLVLATLLGLVCGNISAQDEDCGSCGGAAFGGPPVQGECFTVVLTSNTVDDGGCNIFPPNNCLQNRNCRWTADLTFTRVAGSACFSAKVRRKRCWADVDDQGNVVLPWTCEDSWSEYSGTVPEPHDEPIACGDAKKWEFEGEKKNGTWEALIAISATCSPDCPE